MTRVRKDRLGLLVCNRHANVLVFSLSVTSDERVL